MKVEIKLTDLPMYLYIILKAIIANSQMLEGIFKLCISQRNVASAEMHKLER